MNQIPMFFTHQEMSTEFMDRLRGGFKGDCPCCGRYAQIYKRKLSGQSIRFLIAMYRMGATDKFVNYRDVLHFMNHKVSNDVCDFGKAKYWHLIENMPNTDEAKSSSGCWKLTPFGVDFIRGEALAAAYVEVFDDRVVGSSKEMIHVRDALGEKFNYQELMEA